MPYINGFDRDQMMWSAWSLLVDPESIARLIDAFVDSLDLTELGVKEASVEGRPAYDPRSMFKLYIYGYRYGIRSSRKLAWTCTVNLEVRWMISGVTPDFRTISDFRKNNIDAIKKLFRKFNERLANAVEWGFTAVDGSKFNAWNSKDRNFTKNKLDDRIKWLNEHTDEYLRILEEMDEQDELSESDLLTKEMIEAKLAEAQERLERYQGYQRIMEETGVSQISLTDADARLMKSKNGFVVAYNPQIAVDSETHLIRDYVMTNNVTDHGLLMTTLIGIHNEDENTVIETVADKGYEYAEDMINCLENGIVPYVIPDGSKDEYEFEIEYRDSYVDTTSTAPEDLEKCLHAGKIPDAYKDVITEMKVVEVRRLDKEKESEESTTMESPNELDRESPAEKGIKAFYEADLIPTPESLYGTPEEMQKRAAEGYFVRDPERNLVYCPAGEILRQKCIKKSGCIRYANKKACKECTLRNLCYTGVNEWKEVDFSKNCLEKPCRNWQKELKGDEKPVADAAQRISTALGEAARDNAEETTKQEKKAKRHFKKIQVVQFKFKPDRLKTDQRKCLAEHPFGTIKRAMGSSYFLLKGKKKVDGEFALFSLSYNLVRATNLLGFDKMMELMMGI